MMFNLITLSIRYRTFTALPTSDRKPTSGLAETPLGCQEVVRDDCTPIVP